LEVGIAFGQCGVVVSGDRALDGAAECMWCEKLDLRDGLGRGSALCGKGITGGEARNQIIRKHNITNGLGSHVSIRTVADAVGRTKYGLSFGLLAAVVVAKSNVSNAKIVHFDDKVGVVALAF